MRLHIGSKISKPSCILMFMRPSVSFCRRNRQTARRCRPWVPLFFETGRDEHVDAIVVVTASSKLSASACSLVPGMTDVKFEAVIARQLPEAEKAARADFVVDTSGSVENCNSQIDLIITKLMPLSATAYDRYWRA